MSEIEIKAASVLYSYNARGLPGYSYNTNDLTVIYAGTEDSDDDFDSDSSLLDPSRPKHGAGDLWDMRWNRWWGWSHGRRKREEQRKHRFLKFGPEKKWRNVIADPNKLDKTVDAYDVDNCLKQMKWNCDRSEPRKYKININVCPCSRNKKEQYDYCNCRGRHRRDREDDEVKTKRGYCYGYLPEKRLTADKNVQVSVEYDNWDNLKQESRMTYPFVEEDSGVNQGRKRCPVGCNMFCKKEKSKRTEQHLTPEKSTEQVASYVRSSGGRPQFRECNCPDTLASQASNSKSKSMPGVKSTFKKLQSYFNTPCSSITTLRGLFSSKSQGNAELDTATLDPSYLEEPSIKPGGQVSTRENSRGSSNHYVPSSEAELSRLSKLSETTEDGKINLRSVSDSSMTNMKFPNDGSSEYLYYSPVIFHLSKDDSFVTNEQNNNHQLDWEKNVSTPRFTNTSGNKPKDPFSPLTEDKCTITTQQVVHFSEDNDSFRTPLQYSNECNLGKEGLLSSTYSLKSYDSHTHNIYSKNELGKMSEHVELNPVANGQQIDEEEKYVTVTDFKDLLAYIEDKFSKTGERAATDTEGKKVDEKKTVSGEDKSGEQHNLGIIIKPVIKLTLPERDRESNDLQVTNVKVNFTQTPTEPFPLIQVYSPKVIVNSSGSTKEPLAVDDKKTEPKYRIPTRRGGDQEAKEEIIKRGGSDEQTTEDRLQNKEPTYYKNSSQFEHKQNLTLPTHLPKIKEQESSDSNASEVSESGGCTHNQTFYETCSPIMDHSRKYNSRLEPPITKLTEPTSSTTLTEEREQSCFIYCHDSSDVKTYNNKSNGSEQYPSVDSPDRRKAACTVKQNTNNLQREEVMPGETLTNLIQKEKLNKRTNKCHCKKRNDSSGPVEERQVVDAKTLASSPEMICCPCNKISNSYNIHRKEEKNEGTKIPLGVFNTILTKRDKCVGTEDIGKLENDVEVIKRPKKVYPNVKSFSKTANLRQRRSPERHDRRGMERKEVGTKAKRSDKIPDFGTYIDVPHNSRRNQTQYNQKDGTYHLGRTAEVQTCPVVRLSVPTAPVCQFELSNIPAPATSKTIKNYPIVNFCLVSPKHNKVEHSSYRSRNKINDEASVFSRGVGVQTMEEELTDLFYIFRRLTDRMYVISECDTSSEDIVHEGGIEDTYLQKIRSLVRDLTNTIENSPNFRTEHCCSSGDETDSSCYRL